MAKNSIIETIRIPVFGVWDNHGISGLYALIYKRETKKPQLRDTLAQEDAWEKGEANYQGALFKVVERNKAKTWIETVFEPPIELGYGTLMDRVFHKRPKFAANIKVDSFLDDEMDSIKAFTLNGHTDASDHLDLWFRLQGFERSLVYIGATSVAA